MPKRINIEDSPEYERLFPVQAFFNSMSNSEFVSTVDHLTQGHGTGFNDAYCFFPDDLDEWDLEQGEEPFDGVQFALFEDEVIVDIPTFRRFLAMACEAYLRDHPEDRTKIEEFLARPQPPLTLPGTNVVTGTK